MKIHLDLDYIDEDICSVCGAEIQAARKDRRHSSGEWNEYVEYRCGRILHYSPNFRHVMEEKRCPHDIADKERRDNIATFYGKVLETARSAPCADSEFRNRILYWLESCKPRF